MQVLLQSGESVEIEITFPQSKVFKYYLIGGHHIYFIETDIILRLVLYFTYIGKVSIGIYCIVKLCISYIGVEFTS